MVTCILVLAATVFNSMSVTPVVVVVNVNSLDAPAVVENSFVSFVALLVALLPPEPPLLEEELELDDEVEIVTVAEDESDPPAVPDTESVSVHVPVPEVTVQLWEFDSFPVIVPIVFVPDVTVQPEPLSVAVTLVEDPAVSVPELYIVAEDVKAVLAATLLTDVVNEVMLSAAGDVIVIEPQSAVHSEPRRTQILCAPSDVGVTV